MRKLLICLFALFPLLAGPALAAGTGNATYDLLFRNGTLDEVPKNERLVYVRDVSNALKPETAERDTGKVELAFAGEEPLQARLKFTQGEKYRNLGAFPASVGNPIIMYFVETVVRDMAESAEGSPFYIRNRVKEALVSDVAVIDGETLYDGQKIATHAVTLHPFEGDPNAGRMKGFGDLALIVTMSEKVPGWYHSLEAQVPDPEGGAPIYSSTLRFETVGAAE